MANAPMVRVSTDNLRAAYMPGAKRTGRVDVRHVGLRYNGKPIAILEFARYGEVRYYSDVYAAFCFAAFNKNGATLDD